MPSSPWCHGGGQLSSTSSQRQLSNATMQELLNGTAVLSSGGRLQRMGIRISHPCSRSSLNALIGAFLHGVRLVDIAITQECTGALVDAMHRAAVPRDRMNIISTCHHELEGDALAVSSGHENTTNAIGGAERALQTSGLEQLAERIMASGLGYLDLYMVRADPMDQLEGRWAALARLQSRGTIREMGLCILSDLSALRSLERAALPPPIVVQTALWAPSGNRHKGRNSHLSVEEDFEYYCESRKIVILAHGDWRSVESVPLVERAKSLATQCGVTPLQILLRYGLQRSYTMLFDAPSDDVLSEGLHAFEFELGEQQLADLTCGEQASGQCYQYVGTRMWIGTQQDGGKVHRHFHGSTKGNGKPSPGFIMWPRGGVAYTPRGAPDPVTVVRPAHGGGGGQVQRLPIWELSHTAQLHIAAPQMPALESVFSRAHSGLCEAEQLERNCDFRLHVQRPVAAAAANSTAGADSSPHERLYGTEYVELCRAIASHIPDRNAAFVKVLAWPPKNPHDPLVEKLTELINQYIRPLLDRLAFRGAKYRLSQVGMARKVARPADDTVRKAAGIWHHDDLSDRRVKVILYLNDVDSQRACFMALRHNVTREPIKLRWPREEMWGHSINSEWFLELLQAGYWPECITGPAGTLTVFDNNIVHRGSLPANGRHRDGITFDFDEGEDGYKPDPGSLAVRVPAAMKRPDSVDKEDEARAEAAEARVRQLEKVIFDMDRVRSERPRGGARHGVR